MTPALHDRMAAAFAFYLDGCEAALAEHPFLGGGTR